MCEPNRPVDGPQQQCDAHADPRGSSPGGGHAGGEDPVRDDDAERSVLRRFLQTAFLIAFGHLTGLALRGIGATWRIEELGADPRSSSASESESAHLAAIFHECMLPAAWHYRDRQYTAAVSRSRDGDLVGAALRALGYAAPARGSSSRGGSVALRGLLRCLQQGTTVSVLVDGPRGPAHVSKPGIIVLARMADRPIQPVAFAARPAIRLRSWDQSLIPLPFARVVCAYGEPLRVPKTGDAPPSTEEEEARAHELDLRLESLSRKAAARLA